MEKSLFFWLFLVFVAFLIMVLIIKTIQTDPDWKKHEVLHLEQILRDLISMSDTDQLAKQIVDEFELRLFDYKVVDSLDENQLQDYYLSLNEKVNSIFKCKHYANGGTAIGLLSREKSCRECHGDCTICSYLISREAAYYNDYIKGTEDMYERF